MNEEEGIRTKDVLPFFEKAELQFSSDNHIGLCARISISSNLEIVGT